MGALTVKPDDSTYKYFHAHFRATVAGGADTGIIDIDFPAPITLSLSPGAGVTAAYWEYTITPRDVIAGNASNAIWHKWPLGDVAAADGAKGDALLGPVTAVRGSTTGGNTTFEVAAHKGV